MNEFRSWRSYRDFAYRVRRKSRYIRTPEDEDFLREVLRTSESRIMDLPEGTGLWRAQLGHVWRPRCEGDRHVDDVPAAFPPERMKPLLGRATEGRANPKGIPVLYLSTRRKTAMSEVRPWLGSMVSCARFRITRSLRIVNFSVHQDCGFVVYFKEPDASKREDAVWKHIDRSFSEPTTSADDTADYVPTQLIAELFKSEGYDGIAYKSAFGKKGYNIILFDPAVAELTHCTLFEASSLKFGFRQSDKPHRVENDGSTETARVTDVRPVPSSEETQP